jgi:predicted ATP-binding protein involved in virulence
MRIIKIAVDGLFGIFDHAIPLHLEDRITIIHGPNGFGKTTLLKMLDGLFNRRYADLRDVPFTRFQVDFDDGGVAWVAKTEGRRGLEETKLFYRRPGAARARSFILPSPAFEPTGRRRPPLQLLDDLIAGLVRVGPREWSYGPTREVLSLEEVVDRFGHALPSRWLQELGEISEPDWWVSVRNAIEIRFITAQRLLTRREAPRHGQAETVPAVTQYSEELARIIQQKLAESAELSQSLDRTFPSRLVQQLGHSVITDDELREKLSELEEQRSRLRDAGLLGKPEDVEIMPAEEIIGDARDVLAVYAKDVQKKLSIFDEIASKIELLTTIINRRFLYKKLAISRERGFDFTAPDGQPLQLTKLSSGEQHQLVLLFHLLFKVKPNSFILIDEPELSLHIAWQKQFLQDLREITELALFDVLVATHSPQIIHDRWDLTVELKGPEAS